jgi:hypothetical protein
MNVCFWRLFAINGLTTMDTSRTWLKSRVFFSEWKFCRIRVTQTLKWLNVASDLALVISYPIIILVLNRNVFGFDFPLSRKWVAVSWISFPSRHGGENENAIFRFILLPSGSVIISMTVLNEMPELSPYNQGTLSRARRTEDMILVSTILLMNTLLID